MNSGPSVVTQADTDTPATPVALPAEAQAALEALFSTPGCDFVTLARAAGLDPARDFRGADLRGMDFGASDLRGLDLSGADLEGCDFSRAKLEGAAFTGARRKGEQRFLEIKGHTDFVNSIAISPDASLIITGGGDRTARLWFADSGLQKRCFSGFDSWITCVTFSGDGRLAALGCGDGNLFLLDIATSLITRSFRVTHSFCAPLHFLQIVNLWRRLAMMDWFVSGRSIRRIR